MGFDINITMCLRMSPITGRPYHYGEGRKVDGLPDLHVPEHLRPYMQGRGPIFHAYTHIFNEESRFNVDVVEFLEHFPSWKYVQDDDNDYWSEKDHCLFKELLEWCARQSVEFRVDWSY